MRLAALSGIMRGVRGVEVGCELSTVIGAGPLADGSGGRPRSSVVIR